MIIKVVYINLAKSEKRNQDFINHFATFNIRVFRIEGVDGSKIKKTDITDTISLLEYQDECMLYQKGVRLNKLEMKPGELGCAWSHFNVYKNLLVEPYNVLGYLVLEDDARFIPGMEDKLVDYLKHIPEDADVIQFSSESKYHVIQKSTQINDYYFNIHSNFFNCAASYFVTRVGAAKLLSYGNYTLCVPADDLLSNSFRFKEVKVCVPNEYVFTVDFNYKSDRENIDTNK